MYLNKLCIMFLSPALCIGCGDVTPGAGAPRNRWARLHSQPCTVGAGLQPAVDSCRSPGPELQLRRPVPLQPVQQHHAAGLRADLAVPAPPAVRSAHAQLHLTSSRGRPATSPPGCPSPRCRAPAPRTWSSGRGHTCTPRETQSGMSTSYAATHRSQSVSTTGTSPLV